jgi:hypothetical protein
VQRRRYSEQPIQITHGPLSLHGTPPGLPQIGTPHRLAGDEGLPPADDKVPPMRRSSGERWMRGGIAGVMAVVALLVSRPAAGAQFTHSSVVTRDGNPMLLVDGRPFFFYGAAFFYERIPAPRWRASMLALRKLGFNTLDLYVPWNWHEPADGDFDFDGRTNARRNLRAVLALARELRFKLIVRPGPVIRNEWRNGGYPAWLLTRAEYGMPLHDVLEGRYPATATLQNANSDEAAAQWLSNPTHMTYATRWLRTALAEFVPVADLVVAVQLDDDQGAYIDNQTWPAPNFQAYMRTLEAVVRGVVGSRLPVFINTYEMKVTASAPVWAMGNWYQSDAYSIGEHDRAALEFSTGLLQTQTRFPVAISEFQAGWLAAPEDPAPRPADPSNTTLALHTLLGLGARGAIDFPAQDTVNPAGWEAPFANAAYRWDAALDDGLVPSARYAPTKRFGDLVRDDGSALAAARRLADGAIAYLTSAYDERRQTNADVFAIAARTMEAQQACRARNLTCDLVDLRFGSDATLRRYSFLVVPRAVPEPLNATARRRLAHYRAGGGHVLARPPDVVTPRNGGIADATVLVAADGRAFFDVVNYDWRPRKIPATRIRLPAGRTWTIGPLMVAPRDAVLLRFNPAVGRHPALFPAPRRLDSTRAANASGASGPTAVSAVCTRATGVRAEKPRGAEAAYGTAVAGAVRESPVAGAAGELPVAEAASELPVAEAAGEPRVIQDDRAADGYARLTLTNDLISVTLAPNAGARAFRFSARSAADCPALNVFTSVGSLRDDVAIAPPLSSSDRIGKHTRSFPAGMFNRPFTLTRRSAAGGAASATLVYEAPDVVPNGGRFERTIAIDAAEPGFTMIERATFAAGPRSAAQRVVRYDNFDTRAATTLDESADGAVGFFYPQARYVAIVAWRRGEVEHAQLIPERTSTVLRLQFGQGESRTRYLLEPAADIGAAQTLILKERGTVASKR